MSGAKLSRNGAKARHGANTTRPSGASALATSRDPEALQLAMAIGNRQTRRLALKNTKKLARTKDITRQINALGDRPVRLEV